MLELIEEQLGLDTPKVILLFTQAHVVLLLLHSFTVFIFNLVRCQNLLLRYLLDDCLCVGCLVHLTKLNYYGFFLWLLGCHELFMLDHKAVILELSDLLIFHLLCILIVVFICGYDALFVFRLNSTSWYEIKITKSSK